MHDIRAIRENPAAFDAALSRRGLEPVSSEVLRIDEARRAAILEAETAQAERNTANTAIGFAKSGGDEAEFSRLRELISAKKSKTINMQSRAKELDDQLTKLLEGPAKSALRRRARWRGRSRQCRSPPLGHTAPI